MAHLPFFRHRLHEILSKLAEGQSIDAISWMGLL